MHRIVTVLRSAVKGWGLLEYSLGILCIIAAFTAMYLLIPRSQYATVTVRVSNRDLSYMDEGAPPIRLISQYKEGLTGKDVFGRVIASITDVRAFPHTHRTIYGTAETVDVTAKIAVSHNARTDTYKYKGVSLQIGQWIKIEIGPVVIDGMVTDINGVFQSAPPETVRIKALLKTEDPLDGTNFTNTTGVDPYIANAIVIGDTMKERDGTILARIVDKTVVPARTIAGDLYGNVFERQHPRKVDVTLTVDVQAKKMYGQYYFLDGEPLRVNSRVPLFLDRVTIEPRVTEFITEKP